MNEKSDKNDNKVENDTKILNDNKLDSINKNENAKLQNSVENEKLKDLKDNIDYNFSLKDRKNDVKINRVEIVKDDKNSKKEFDVKNDFTSINNDNENKNNDDNNNDNQKYNDDNNDEGNIVIPIMIPINDNIVQDSDIKKDKECILKVYRIIYNFFGCSTKENIKLLINREQIIIKSYEEDSESYKEFNVIEVGKILSKNIINISIIQENYAEKNSFLIFYTNDEYNEDEIFSQRFYSSTRYECEKNVVLLNEYYKKKINLKFEISCDSNKSEDMLYCQKVKSNLKLNPKSFFFKLRLMEDVFNFSKIKTFLGQLSESFGTKKIKELSENKNCKSKLEDEFAEENHNMIEKNEKNNSNISNHSNKYRNINTNKNYNEFKILGNVIDFEDSKDKFFENPQDNNSISLENIKVKIDT